MPQAGLAGYPPPTRIVFRAVLTPPSYRFMCRRIRHEERYGKKKRLIFRAVLRYNGTERRQFSSRTLLILNRVRPRFDPGGAVETETGSSAARLAKSECTIF